MSYDLAVWQGARPVDDAAAEADYIALTERWDAGEQTPPSPAIRSYVEALLARWPDITTDEGVDSPWADGPMIGNATGATLYFSMVWSRCEEASAFAAHLAADHGLVCFDPQTGKLRPESPTAVLRAVPEVGAAIIDPSEDMLFTLLADIEAGQGTYLIVERTSDATGQTYAQTLRRDDGSYVVEHREGSPDRHDGTAVPDMRSAHRLLAGWAFELPGWDDGVAWSAIHV